MDKIGPIHSLERKGKGEVVFQKEKDPNDKDLHDMKISRRIMNFFFFFFL